VTNVACTNTDCPEHDIPKTSAYPGVTVPAAEIHCGACGGPVAPTDRAADTEPPAA